MPAQTGQTPWRGHPLTLVRLGPEAISLLGADSVPMITCRHVVEQVDAFLDREMSFADRFWYRLHLGLCKACRDYVDQMRRTIDLVERLGKDHEGCPKHRRQQLLKEFRKCTRDRCDEDADLE